VSSDATSASPSTPVHAAPTLVTTLTTARLVIVPLAARYREVCVAAYAASNALWSSYLASAASGEAPEVQFDKRLERSVEGWSKGVVAGTEFVFVAVDRATGAFVGDCNLGGLFRGSVWECNIGWRVAADAQGKGLAFEMVRAVVAWGFGPEPAGPNLHRICAAIMPGNDRSIRLAERLGFAFEGTKRELILIGGTWRDHHLYGLINRAWVAR